MAEKNRISMIFRLCWMAYNSPWDQYGLAAFETALCHLQDNLDVATQLEIGSPAFRDGANFSMGFMV